jgi:four helix bundle suffix protein
MKSDDSLIPKHGGYRNLKSFQIAQLVYDVTVRFCDRYIDKRSRTHDQMVQAARSGVQNIAEGSKASGTSKKMELKLTNVARASLEELRLDYEDFLRQRGLDEWEPEHPALKRFKKRRCSTLEEVRDWVHEEYKRQQRKQHGQERQHGQTQEHGQTRTDTDEKDKRLKAGSVSVGVRPCQPVSYSTLAANAALSLLNLACYLLDRQISSQAEAFKKNGGFTERLYRTRKRERSRS